MAQQVPYRPCPACGGCQYHNFADLAADVQKALGRGARQSIPGATWEYSLVVCAGCGFTDVYTRNAALLAQRVSTASQFEAV